MTNDLHDLLEAAKMSTSRSTKTRSKASNCRSRVTVLLLKTGPQKAGIDSVGLEAMAVIVSVVSFLEKIGITHEERQKYLHLVNESNANRDNGKRVKE